MSMMDIGNVAIRPRRIVSAKLENRTGGALTMSEGDWVMIQMNGDENSSDGVNGRWVEQSETANAQKVKVVGVLAADLASLASNGVADVQVIVAGFARKIRVLDAQNVLAGDQLIPGSNTAGTADALKGVVNFAALILTKTVGQAYTDKDVCYTATDGDAHPRDTASTAAEEGYCSGVIFDQGYL